MDLGNTSGARRPTRSPRSRSDRSLSGAATTVCGEGTRPRPGGLPSDRCASSSARSRARARTAVMCSTSSNRRPSAHCRQRGLDRLPRPLVGRRLLARTRGPLSGLPRLASGLAWQNRVSGCFAPWAFHGTLSQSDFHSKLQPGTVWEVITKKLTGRIGASTLDAPLQGSWYLTYFIRELV